MSVSAYQGLYCTHMHKVAFYCTSLAIYPIPLCYAMTNNKSQGQTLDRVDVYLPKPMLLDKNKTIQLQVTQKEILANPLLNICVLCGALPHILCRPDCTYKCCRCPDKLDRAFYRKRLQMFPSLMCPYKLPSP